MALGVMKLQRVLTYHFLLYSQRPKKMKVAILSSQHRDPKKVREGLVNRLKEEDQAQHSQTWQDGRD